MCNKVSQCVNNFDELNDAPVFYESPLPQTEMSSSV